MNRTAPPIVHGRLDGVGRVQLLSKSKNRFMIRAGRLACSWSTSTTRPWVMARGDSQMAEDVTRTGLEAGPLQGVPRHLDDVVARPE